MGAGHTDNVDAGRTVSYTFDSLNRLTSALTTGSTNYPQWGLSWTYDRYGNRKTQTVTAGSGPSPSVTVDATTNRVSAIGMTTLSYDANGNLAQDDLYKYVYDAENNLVQLQQLNGTNIATYSFDGNGTRVVKVVGTSRYYSIYEGTQLISEFSDASSATYTSGTTPQQAPSDSVSLLLYQHPDHLTARTTTDNSGNTASLEAHYPYGETWYDIGAASGSVMRKFTSYNKDSEASSAMLNYATFRQHSSRIGRFLTADPAESAASGGAQALNRYSYVAGDPVNRLDPQGMLSGGFSAFGFCALGINFLRPNFFMGGGPGILVRESPIDPICTDPGDDFFPPSPRTYACSEPGTVRLAGSGFISPLKVVCGNKPHTAYAVLQGRGARFPEVQVTNVKTTASRVVDLHGEPKWGPKNTQDKALYAFQSFSTNISGGQINWTVEWKCGDIQQTPLEGTTTLKCSNGF